MIAIRKQVGEVCSAAAAKRNAEPFVTLSLAGQKALKINLHASELGRNKNSVTIFVTFRFRSDEMICQFSEIFKGLSEFLMGSTFKNLGC